MYQVTKYDGNTGNTVVLSSTTNATQARRIADRMNANREHGSSDSFGVSKRA